MTVLAGIVVNPGNGLRPYALIGADSKSVDVLRNTNSDGIVEEKVINIDEHTRKVFKPNKHLIIGFSGTSYDEFVEDFLSYVKMNLNEDVTLIEAAPLVQDWIRSKSSGINNLIPNAEVIIGGYVNNVASLCYFSFGDDSDDQIHYRIPGDEQVYPILGAGSAEMKERLRNRIASGGLDNITNTRLALIEYLQTAARLDPESCNENIIIERLK